eukprot:747573-Hanusia_phi.AAC.1
MVISRYRDDDDSEKPKGRRKAKKENVRDSPTADSPSDSNSRESPIDEASRKRGYMEYQGTHPVEFGIMQHQLNPIQSVHIFDEDQDLREESPSDQDLYSTPINIRASSFDNAQVSLICLLLMLLFFLLLLVSCGCRVSTRSSLILLINHRQTCRTISRPKEVLRCAPESPPLTRLGREHEDFDVAGSGVP